MEQKHFRSSPRGEWLASSRGAKEEPGRKMLLSAAAAAAQATVGFSPLTWQLREKKEGVKGQELFPGHSYMYPH